MIVAGGGVIMSGGLEEAKALAEFLQAPVVNSYLHNDSFPADHPLWCGPLGYQGSKAAMKVIAQADVVLALGTRLGPFGTLPQHGLDYWPKNAKIIQVDSDHRMLGLVKQISVGVCGDAKAAARSLHHRLANRDVAARKNASERLETVKAEKDAWEKELDELDAREGRSGRSRSPRTRAACIRARCCASWRRPCPRTPWSPPTSATSARSPTAICASTSPIPCSPP